MAGPGAHAHMVDDEGLRYDLMVERALRGVLRDALCQVAEMGLPGEHRLFITYRTDHPGVELPADLRERYPNEMTIVLEHQFWGLEVGDDAFAVTLSFSNEPERLSIPFDAVIAFADPSVRFGLQFDGGLGEVEVVEKPSAEVTDLPVDEAKRSKKLRLTTRQKGEDPKARPAAAKAPPADEEAEIVPLDTFRKK